jgi:hypothetical protein
MLNGKENLRIQKIKMNIIVIYYLKKLYFNDIEILKKDLQNIVK